MHGKVLSWFESYFEGRSQQVSINGSLRKQFDLMCEVPKGSCLAAPLFTIYVSKLFQIFKTPSALRTHICGRHTVVFVI